MTPKQDTAGSAGKDRVPVAAATAVHPKWDGTSLAEVQRLLRASLGLPPLTLLNTWGNLIWTDGTITYKLTREDDQELAHSGLAASLAILEQDPMFPTVKPESNQVLPLDLQELGRWHLTTWHYHKLWPITPTPDETEPYYHLGQVLKRLHQLEIPSLKRHDPLQWARARIRAIAARQDVNDLHSQLEHLAKRYQQTHPPEHDVTVHGDIHWHQTGLDQDGKLMLVDFETAAHGHPSVDLVPSAGWLKRTGPPTINQTQALHAGYGNSPELTTDQTEVGAAIAAFSQTTWKLAHN